MIVWLASFPRSGNGFFRVVSRRVFGRETWSIYNEKQMPVNSSELARMQRDNETYLVKTHEMPSDSNPAICLVRDGRDSLVSLTWFYLTSQTDPKREIPEKTFRKALKKHILSDTFGGWSNNILAWTRRPHNTTVVRFDDLIVHPEQTMADAFDAVGLDSGLVGKLKPPSFKQLQQRNPYLYRKGKVGGWQKEMPEDLHELFWKKHGEAMVALGYPR